MINMEVYEKCLKFKDKNGRWPRSNIKVNGKRLFKKDIKNNPEYENLEEEFDLAYEWKKSTERKLLMDNKGVKIEDIPEEYQDMIRTLRSFGLGVDCKTVDIVQEFVNFYKAYGRVPRRAKDGKTLTKEEQIEKRLYDYWCRCDENKLLEKYVSIELNEIPEEHRDMVKKLRSIGLGLKSKKTTNLVDYIAFVQDKKREPVYIMHPKNKEEEYERDLKQRWRMCKEHSTYEKYKGVLLREIPEEDRALIEKIRNLWLEVDGNNISEDIINFVEKYNREPRNIKTSLKQFEGGLTEEEQNESILNARWERAFEKQVLDRFVGVPNDEVPNGYKRIVNKFRKIGLGFPESINTRRYISFILEHKRRPRQVIYRNGSAVSSRNYTAEEADEVAIRYRWDGSNDRAIYERYKNSDLDDKTVSLYSDMIKALQEAHEIERAGRIVKIERRKKRSLQKYNKERAERRRIAKEEREIIVEKQKKAKEKRKIAEKRRKKAKEKEKRKIVEECRKRAEPKKEISEQKILQKIEIAKKYATFIKEFHREPRFVIMREGKVVETNNLLPNEVAEIELRRAWRRSEFVDIIEEYAGTPIDELPEICKDTIADFRKLGFGLTYEEYVEFRETNTSRSVLRCVKKTHDKGLNKKRIAEESERAKEEERRSTEEEKESVSAEKRRIAEEAKRIKAEKQIKIAEDQKRAKEEEKRKIAEERRRKKEEPKKKIIEQKILKKIEIAKEYVAFIKEFHREPRLVIVKEGNVVEMDNLLPNEVAEIELRKAWKRSKFVDIIEEYAGTPIDELPEICKDTIADFRKLGFGLTYEEYAKFREANTTRSVLRRLKTIRNRALKKKSKALVLEKRVLDELKLRGKEQDDR